MSHATSPSRNVLTRSLIVMVRGYQAGQVTAGDAARPARAEADPNQIQGRSAEAQRRDDEALQGAWRQSLRRMPAGAVADAAVHRALPAHPQPERPAAQAHPGIQPP